MNPQKIQLHTSPSPENETPMPEENTAFDRIYQSNQTESEQPMTTEPKPKKKFKLKAWHKVLLVFVLFAVVIGGALAAVGFYTLGVVGLLKLQTNQVQAHAGAAYDQFKGQNLPGTESELNNLAEELKTVRGTFSKLSFYRRFPLLNTYYNDGVNGLDAADAGVAAAKKAVAAIAPHADLLGFTGEGTFKGGTAEDRLRLVLQTLEKISPQLDDIAKDLETVGQKVSKIDPNRYPESFQGKPLRSYIQKGKDYSEAAAKSLTEFRPVIERLNSVAGGNKKRKKYLVLMQNSSELRATGGFTGAFAVIFVEDGKVTLEKSDDIYSLDAKFSKKLPIPEKLGKYLVTEKQWNIRDMNIYPDFKTSMDAFMENYKTLRDEPKDIDGIIAVDTHVLTDVVSVIGPVEVPGFGTFSAEPDKRCDNQCPQIIYTLSDMITKPVGHVRTGRKDVLGVLMRSILDKVYRTPKEVWPKLLETGWKDVQARHVQFYFFDEQNQAAAEVVNAAGRMKKNEQAEDFLGIVNMNLGGAKSNLFITYDVLQEVSAPANGQVTKKVTVTYKNSRKGDNCNLEAGLLCLNSTLRDWTRIYLPKGAKMTNTQGFKEGTAKQYEEGEFSVIDGEFTLQPLSQAKIIVEYTVPVSNAKDYTLQIWKQGGLKPIPMTMEVNGNQEAITVDSDTVFKTQF